MPHYRAVEHEKASEFVYGTGFASLSYSNEKMRCRKCIVEAVS
jgi:hypothetical protein